MTFPIDHIVTFGAFLSVLAMYQNIPWSERVQLGIWRSRSWKTHPWNCAMQGFGLLAFAYYLVCTFFFPEFSFSNDPIPLLLGIFIFPVQRFFMEKRG